MFRNGALEGFFIKNGDSVLQQGRS